MPQPKNTNLQFSGGFSGDGVRSREGDREPRATKSVANYKIVSFFLQSFPLTHEVTHLPHQGLMPGDDGL